MCNWLGINFTMEIQNKYSELLGEMNLVKVNGG